SSDFSRPNSPGLSLCAVQPLAKGVLVVGDAALFQVVVDEAGNAGGVLVDPMPHDFAVPGDAVENRLDIHSRLHHQPARMIAVGDQMLDNSVPSGVSTLVLAH